MDQNPSDVLDDRDEFTLDDRDEFFSDVQKLFFRTRADANHGMAILAHRGYDVTLSCEEETPFSPITWVVEGRR